MSPFPTEARAVVNLNSGAVIIGAFGEVTEDEYNQTVSAFGEVAQRSTGWQITLDTGNGRTVIIPKESVDYISVECKTWRVES